MRFPGRWRGSVGCCGCCRDRSMTWPLRARRERRAAGAPAASARQLWLALERQPHADGHRLVVAVVLAGCRADADKSNQLVAQVGAGADVEQEVAVVDLEHGNR